MSTPISDFLKAYYRQRIKKSKSTLFHFENNILYIGKCTIAVIHDKLILINETVDMPEVNRLKENILKTCKEFKYTPILIPFNYGEEDMPNNEEITQRLESRLQYWLRNTQELSNYKIRCEYKAYYDQFRKFIYATSNNKVNSQLKALYTSLNDKKYIKELKLQVAKRKSNLK